MDVEMMRQYYRDTYQYPTDAAVASSEEFRQKRDLRYKIEEKVEKYMEKDGCLKVLFDEYLTALADEHNVIEEELYLMGAADRERMLK